MAEFADKLPNAPFGIAAKFNGNVTTPDQDGQSWHVLVTDGASAPVQITVSMSGTEVALIDPTTLDSPESLEAAVERAAIRVSRHGRLADPPPTELVLRPGDFD